MKVAQHRVWFWLVLLCCTVSVMASDVANDRPAAEAAFQIDADYPGGNILVTAIDGNTVTLRPDLRDTAGWWFYWNFRVRGAAGRTLHFQFAERNPIGTRGPAVSLDQGQTWSWLDPNQVQGSCFTYSFPPSAQDVRFCFSIPYQQSDLERFLGSYADDPHIEVSELCRTRQGRRVECLRVGSGNHQASFQVLLTARHHACESMASFVLEGVLHHLLQSSPEGQWLRRHCEFLVVPFMDKDGVEKGDQGKNRKPHDHNRDYSGDSLYPSVRSLRQRIHAWSEGKPLVAFDFHCPYIRGQNNEHIYIVGSREQENWQQQCRFAEHLERLCRGPLAYRAQENIPFGQAWNTDKDYSQGKSFSRWATDLPGRLVAASVEFPYANVYQETVTPARARGFGRDFARALEAYLQDVPPQASRGDPGRWYILIPGETMGGRCSRTGSVGSRT